MSKGIFFPWLSIAFTMLCTSGSDIHTYGWGASRTRARSPRGRILNVVLQETNAVMPSETGGVSPVLSS